MPYDMDYVFVYGTLRQGGSNHHLLRNAQLMGLARTTEFYALYRDVIPYVVQGREISPILGEVYQVDQETFEQLDLLEGHPDWYVRERKVVRLESGEELGAWIYFFPQPKGELVPSGDFFS